MKAFFRRFSAVPALILVLATAGITARRMLARDKSIPAAIAVVAASGSANSEPGARTFSSIPPPNAVRADAPTEARDGAARTGRAQGSVTLPLKIRWQHAVSGAVAAQVTASPSGDTLYVVTLGGRLEALATRDGTSRFSFDLGDRAYGSPAIGRDGTIYVGSDAGIFYALRPNGEVRFRSNLPREKGPHTQDAKKPGEIDVAPLLVPASSGASSDIVFAAGNVVYRLGEGGSIRSRFVASSKVFTAPAALPDGTLVFGDQAGIVHGIAADGTERFHTALDADVDGSPAVFDNGDFVVGVDASKKSGLNGAVVRLDGAGKILWRTELPGHVRGPLAIGRDGDVRVGHFAGEKGGPAMVRLRGTDGAKLVEIPFRGTGSREFGIVGGPTEAANGVQLFGTPHDDLVIVPPPSAPGEPAPAPTLIALDGDIDAPPTVLPSGEVVVATRAGSVYLLGP